TSFFYLGGDGQEVMPVEASGAATPVDLPEPLEVGVARGTLPVVGATVRFEVISGGGVVDGVGGPIEVLTDANGVASCTWSVSSDCGPLQGAKVKFRGNGKFTPGTATTDASGVASTRWTLDNWNPANRNFAQVAEALLVQLGPNAGASASIDPSAKGCFFIAHLNVADEVEYDPTCQELKALNVGTVKDALDGLCGLLPK